MVSPIPDVTKREAIRLRVGERLGLEDIALRTGSSKSSLSTLLKAYPLSHEELTARRSESAVRNNPTRKYKPTLSKLAQWVTGRTLTTDQKGHIAEDAVRLRLRVLGYQIHTLPDNSRADLAVSRFGSRNFVRFQVKWARRDRWGRPTINLRNGEGRKVRRASGETCDYVIGYDIEGDIAYVIPIAICQGNSTKSCDEKYAEAWHLLEV